MAIELLVTHAGDYFEKSEPRVSILHPWGDPQKLNLTFELDIGGSAITAVSGITWVPGGDFLYISTEGSGPSGYCLHKRGNVVQVAQEFSPIGANGKGVSISRDGKFVAFHVGSTGIMLYGRNGVSNHVQISFTTGLTTPANFSTFAWDSSMFSYGGATGTSSFNNFRLTGRSNPGDLGPIRNPSSLSSLSKGDFTFASTNTCYSACWSPENEYVALGCLEAPYIVLYKRNSSSTLNKQPDPAILPEGAGTCLSFDWRGEILAVGMSVYPYIAFYYRSGGVLTRLANPTVLPSSAITSLDFSPDGDYICVTHGGSAIIYKKDGSDESASFSNLATPPSLGIGNIRSCSWSPNRQVIAFGGDASPFISMYQTGLKVPTHGDILLRAPRKSGT